VRERSWKTVDLLILGGLASWPQPFGMGLLAHGLPRRSPRSKHVLSGRSAAGSYPERYCSALVPVLLPSLDRRPGHSGVRVLGTVAAALPHPPSGCREACGTDCGSARRAGRRAGRLGFCAFAAFVPTSSTCGFVSPRTALFACSQVLVSGRCCRWCGGSCRCRLQGRCWCWSSRDGGRGGSDYRTFRSKWSTRHARLACE